MRLALVAHDQMKDEIIGLVHKYKEFFARQELVATATTGGLIAAKTGFKVERVLSGPQGGDVQIASQVACGTVQAVI
ncbi:MAG: methylglyoxal synthase, partial [bacterium]|nr:methylglyoxal synthase [bacterium]